MAAALVLWLALFSANCPAGETEAAAGASIPGAETNRFPSAAEVLGGRTFETFTEQDVYFLRAIHDRYPAQWPDLLTANITLKDYLLSPEKLQRFVNELGEAMAGRNDLAACTNLAMLTGDATFYANANTYHPEILQAAARALIRIGPEGSKALASAFTESHYDTDPGSLEDLADAIGGEHPADPDFVRVLAATAFDFATTNGSYYPRCTTAAVKNLLCLKDGLVTVRAHLRTEEMLGNPGRFQAVMDGIAAGQARQLATNLVAVQAPIRVKLEGLTNSPGGYRDDLQELSSRIGRTLTGFEKPESASHASQ
jgi:hypothetical protein